MNYRKALVLTSCGWHSALLLTKPKCERKAFISLDTGGTDSL